MGVKVREKVKGSGEWWIFIDHRGKRKSRKIGKDKRLAREVARKIEARLVLGEMNLEKAESKMPTFGDVAGLWIAWPHDWKESTRENYRDNLTNHVFPVFEKVQIDQITRKDLKLFFDKKYSNGLKLQTIKVLGAPINGVLSHAVRELEVMEHNPMRDVVLNSWVERFSLLMRDKTPLNCLISRGPAVL